MNRARLRFIRSFLVVGVGVWLAYGQVSRLISMHASQRVDPARHFRTDPVGILELAGIVPLVLGVLAEFTWFRAARVINVGYYAGWALYLCIGFAFSLVGAFWFREPEHWVLVVMFTAVPYAAFSVVLWFLYRSTDPARPTPKIAA